MELIKIIEHYFENKDKLIYGITDATQISSNIYNLKSVIENNDVPFISNNFEKRTNVSTYLDDAKSIIVVGKSYNYDIELKHFSKLCIGKDYHIEIQQILENLAIELKKYHELDYKILVDNHDLLERELAIKAGLGFRGKNNAIVNNKIGSIFNIGLLIINKEIIDSEINDARDGEIDQNITVINCGSCELCIKSCPTKALSEYNLDYSKCIAYLTQKKELSTEEEFMLNDQIYGCDICIDVCPFNKGNKISVGDEIIYTVNELAEMDKMKFKELCSDKSMYWRGLKTIHRNIDLMEKKG